MANTLFVGWFCSEEDGLVIIDIRVLEISESAILNY